MQMPLDIDNNTKAPGIEVRSSVTVELIAAIHYLSDRGHHSFGEKLGSTLLNVLSIDSLKMLKILSGMRLQGLELFEFVIKERAFDDVELLMERLSQYRDVDFIYNFLGEVLEHDRIQSISQGAYSLEKLQEEKPRLVNENIRGFEHLFFNTSQFRTEVIHLIREMNNSILISKLATLKQDYCKQAEKVRCKLKDKNPMEVSQEIMDRQFKRVYNFNKYYFVPSYFISPHKIRVFCSDAQIIVFALDQNQSAINEIGDKVSLVFKIISDRTRLEILREIIVEPTYGKLLAEKLNLTTATISHHIEVLKSINLIGEKRLKNIKYFEANEEEIRKLFEGGLEYLFKK
jgi:DNA-binding transcriptional ArsR family regulator